jgi:hypothetical protein
MRCPRNYDQHDGGKNPVHADRKIHQAGQGNYGNRRLWLLLAIFARSHMLHAYEETQTQILDGRSHSSTGLQGLLLRVAQEMSLLTHLNIWELLLVVVALAWMVLDTNVEIDDILGDASPFDIKDVKLRNILLGLSPFVQIFRRFLAALILALGILDYFTPEGFFSSTKEYVIGFGLLILISVVGWNTRHKLLLASNAALSTMSRLMRRLQTILIRAHVLLLNRLALGASNLDQISRLCLVRRTFGRFGTAAILSFAIMTICDLPMMHDVAIDDDQQAPTSQVRIKIVKVKKAVLEGDLQPNAPTQPTASEAAEPSQPRLKLAAFTDVTAAPFPEWKAPFPEWKAEWKSRGDDWGWSPTKEGQITQPTPQPKALKLKPSPRRAPPRPHSVTIELPEAIATMPEFQQTIEKYGRPTSISLNSDGHAFVYYDHMTQESYMTGEGLGSQSTSETTNLRMTNCQARFEFYFASVGDRQLPIKNSQNNCHADFRRSL